VTRAWSRRRTWATWTATFLAFPPSGAAALLAGPVDGLASALLGGAIAGSGIGLAQWLVLRRVLPGSHAWAPATALAVAGGLLAGGATVSWQTNLSALAVQGAVTGAVVGAAQALVLARAGASRAAAGWAVAAPALWALGWAVTTLAGVDVERHYAVFGATGALVHAAASGAILARLLPVARPADGSSEPAPRRRGPDPVSTPVEPRCRLAAPAAFARGRRSGH
jgi:hypothetical protein